MSLGKYAVMVVALSGCSDWTQVKNAHDAEGQLVRVESKGKEPTTVDELILCDKEGFLFAGDSRDCEDAPFDVRKDKVFKHDKDTKSSVGMWVAGVLTAIVVPLGIVGTAILSSK
ncbi:MAG TPA: hypothetical protein VGH87_24900 [Polyangiaceae bacterium]|jgi:hypothetical protein|nr:hypothetical protein [Polyangiaceae bacterium]